MNLQTENDLHYLVNTFLSKNYAGRLVQIGMGEYLDSSTKRVDAHRKGYISGTCDITINVYNTYYRGLAIELKNPRTCGYIKPNQVEYMNKMKKNRYKTLISNDIFEIYNVITEYMRTTEGLCCPYCDKTIKTNKGVDNHCIVIHKKDPKTGESILSGKQGEIYTDDKKYVIQDFRLYKIDRIMNKSYHCLRIGLKRKRQDSENKRIREFNVNKILNTGKWIKKCEVNLDELLTENEASKRFEFNRILTYNYVEIK